MQRMSMMARGLACAAAFLMSFLSAQGGPALEELQDLAQPDGASFKARIRGDEFQGWVETEDGHTIVRRASTGAWEYAVPDSTSGRLLPGGQVVGAAGGGPPRVAKNLRPERNLQLEKQQRLLLEEMNRERFAATEAGPGIRKWEPVPVSGTKRALFIMVGFANRAPQTTASQWNTALFSTGAGVKSVRQYYRDLSFNALDMQPIPHTMAGYPAGVIAVTLAINHPNYEMVDTQADYDAEAAMVQAVLNVAKNYVDFGSLDTNGDGQLKPNEAVIYLLVAGYETSGSAKQPSVWAHAMTWPNKVYAGVKMLPVWAMNGELSDGGNRHPIGVVAHELGHQFCGLPDLYDTAYANRAMSLFSLMAGGSWGGDVGEEMGATPTLLDAWSRIYLGWATAQQPANGAAVSLAWTLANTSSVVKLVNPSLSTNEYFLIDHRRPQGWDLGLNRWFGSSWSGGLLVQHIDTAIGTLAQNDINKYVAGSHQGVMPEHAGGHAYGAEATANTLFYQGLNASFTSNTTPASRYYNLAGSGLGITSISAPGATMTFSVMAPVAVTTNRIVRVEGDLAFGGVLVGSTAQRALTIRNDGNAALNVSSVTYPAGFSGAWTGAVPAGGARAVTVQFAPSSAVSYGGNAVVNSDATAGNNALAVSGTGIAAATRIIRLAGNLAFGTVAIGGTSTRALTIANDGNAALSVTSLSYPSGFSGAWTGSVAAGSSVVVSVTFQPVSATTYSGTLTVSANHTSGGNTIAVSGTGQSVLSLGAGLDATNLAWVTGGDGDWATQTNTTHDGVDAAQSASITNSASTWVQTSVSEGGTLSFWWRVSSENGYDVLSFAIDGVTQAGSLSGESGWQQYSVALAAGVHTLRWTYAKDGSVVAGLDAAWLDQVIFAPASQQTRILRLAGDLNFGAVPLGSSAQRPLTIHNDGNSPLTVTEISGPTGFTCPWTGVVPALGQQVVAVTYAPFSTNVASGNLSVTSDKTAGTSTIAVSGQGTSMAGSLGEAVDAAWLTWSSDASNPWYHQAAFTHDGVDAARSGAIGNYQSNWFATAIEGPGTLAFWCRTSSEPNYDYLHLYLDGEEAMTPISGTGGWQYVSVAVPAGVHEARWVYSKDVSLAVGEDAAFVDEVSYTPGGEELDWWTQGDGFWFIQSAISHDGAGAFQSGDVEDDEWTEIFAEVTGPGVLDFWWGVSSETNYDWLVFSVNGTNTAWITGHTTWLHRQYVLPMAGVHTLSWYYIKDESVSAGWDAGWLDEVNWHTDRVDGDGDGLSDWKEWLVGTDWGNAGSCLRLCGAVVPAGTNVNITWESVTGKTYAVCRSTNLAAGAFVALKTNIAGQAGTTTYTDTNAPARGAAAYRVHACP